MEREDGRKEEKEKEEIEKGKKKRTQEREEKLLRERREPKQKLRSSCQGIHICAKWHAFIYSFTLNEKYFQLRKFKDSFHHFI